MPLKKNILANYLGAGAVALAPILALPWYLSALGPEQFGLVGFVVMLQAVLGLLDAGMSQALVREFAVRFDTTRDGRRNAAVLLFGFERLYWIFAVCAGLATWLMAGSMATHWLKLGDMPASFGKTAVYGAAAIFAAQFPGSIYRSLLVGAQAQVRLNCVMVGGALLRHLGGVVVVLIWPALSTYLIWQAFVALIETLVRGREAWNTLGIRQNQVGWEIKELRSTWRFVAGMSGAALLGALTVQMDKIILSRMVPIEQFGYYTIAVSVALGMLQLIYPLLQGVMPRIVQYRADSVALRRLNLKLTLWIGLLFGPAVLGFIILGKPFLQLWLRNAPAVEFVYPVASILLAGTCLNAFYNVGYINWITHKKTEKAVLVNATALILSVVLIPVFVIWKGAIGAAAGWSIINLIGLTLSLEWLGKKTV